MPRKSKFDFSPITQEDVLSKVLGPQIPEKPIVSIMNKICNCPDNVNCFCPRALPEVIKVNKTKTIK